MIGHSAGFVEAIYEAAFLPERWPHLLEAVAGAAGGIAGEIVIGDMVSCPRFSASRLSEGPLTAYFESGSWRDARRTEAIISYSALGFVRDYEFMDENQRETDVLGGYFRQAGLGGYVGTVIVMPTGERVAVSFLRHQADGYPDGLQLEFLNTLRPHFARACMIAARLRLQQARGTVATLEALGIAAAVLASGDRIVACNALFEGLAPTAATTAFDRIVLSDPRAQVLFQQANAGFRSGHGAKSISFPVRFEEGAAAFVFHLLPIAGSARDIFQCGDTLLAVTRVDRASRVPDGPVLNALFDLTPSEARLAIELASGREIKQAALNLGIGKGTARNYLERIFQKTGTHKQGELVSLLKSI
jgi:DNA-binding CsgD family transcriptional regulator